VSKGMKVRSFYPATIQLDDPETGELREVAIRVKRMDLDTFSRWAKDCKRSEDPASNRMLGRKPDGEEQEKDDQGNYKIDAEEVARRRLVEMTDDERKRYDALDAEDEAFSKKFLAESIRQYVTVEDGELSYEDENGEEVTVRTGVQLLKLYGARRDVLAQLIRAIWQENTVSANTKKVWRSLSALRRSLNAQALAAVGQIPAPIVDAAGTAASAEIEDAPDRHQIPCGLEAQPSAP
jgi:hypothetical protein